MEQAMWLISISLSLKWRFLTRRFWLVKEINKMCGNNLLRLYFHTFTNWSAWKESSELRVQEQSIKRVLSCQPMYYTENSHYKKWFSTVRVIVLLTLYTSTLTFARRFWSWWRKSFVSTYWQQYWVTWGSCLRNLNPGIYWTRFTWTIFAFLWWQALLKIRRKK